jgi:hypothetical protein
MKGADVVDKETVKADMGRVERYIRTHKKEVVIGVVCFVVGSMFTSRRYRNHISTEFANKLIKDVFDQAQGDFTKAAGGYLVPQIKVVG